MCLQQLEIGGVETAVMTLCKGYIRAGHKVFVAAKSGIFNEQLEKLGIEVLDIEYELLNEFPLNRKDELIKYCKDKKITEIHIHQYPCVLYWLPVCIELKLPYVAYVHSIVPGAPEWFMNTFQVHKTALPIFFENASKIVCITESTKQEIESLFKVGNDKYKIIPNSLNMEDFLQTRTVDKIKNFGIAARFSEEKVESIKKAIDLFTEYCQNKKDCKLLIAGDGPEKETIKKYVKEKKQEKNIKFLGAISNMSEYLGNLDVFLGVDRCILEAIACKRLAIISSYNKSLNIVTKENIEQASFQNFSGMNLEDNKNILQELEKITEKKYQEITTDNYKYINKKYNVDNNLYTYELTNNYTKDYNKIFLETNILIKEIEAKNRVLEQKWTIKKIFKKIKNLIKRILSKMKKLLTK